MRHTPKVLAEAVSILREKAGDIKVRKSGSDWEVYGTDVNGRTISVSFGSEDGAEEVAAAYKKYGSGPKIADVMDAVLHNEL